MNLPIKQIHNLLSSSKHEISNLQLKLANNEQEGWEGSKRRLILKKDIDDILEKIETILSEGADGNGI